jgi:hypothetical protein
MVPEGVQHDTRQEANGEKARLKAPLRLLE